LIFKNFANNLLNFLNNLQVTTI